MARVTNKLTVKQIENLKVPGYYSDGGGLYLQVSQTLSKSWLYIYYKAKKKTEMGLGSLKELSLSEARDKARECKKNITNDIDPLNKKRRLARESVLASAKDKTFKQCAEDYIKENREGWRNPKHVQQWTNTLEQYAYPVFGQVSVADIDTGLILQCLSPIWTTKNETASRVRGRIEKILSSSTTRGLRTGENPARWRDHLQNILPAPNKVQNKKHHPALPYLEIGTFMSLLKNKEGIAAKCLQFTILTAARTEQAIGATWDEVDFATKVWTIPAERMKAKKDHRVPLSDSCLDLLIEMRHIRLNEYIFPGKKKGISNMAMSQLLKRMDRTDITVHGFRSTFRDWAAETTTHKNELLENCLAHTIKNEAEAAYRRGDMLEKRFKVMNEWAKYCGNERVAGGNVTPLRTSL